MADNMVTLVGNLGADPELRRTPTGKDVVSFNLVTNERIRAADGSWTDGPSSWFRITAWNDLGRNAAMSFRKGQRVIARGTLKVETWQARDGGTGKTVELTARSLGHDVLWGTSSFVRSGGERPPAPVERPADDPWASAPAEEAQEDAAPAAPSDWGSSLGDDGTPF
jgi:single-strand DNA-binding protein